MERLKRPEELPRFGMRELLKLCEGKNVCLVGSLPPTHYMSGLNPDATDYLKADIVVRCNDWWAYDEGRIDVLFHIGASEKIKPSWLLGHTKVIDQMKLLCLYGDGADSRKMMNIMRISNRVYELYNKQSIFLKPLRKWFGARGTSPSTGLTAAYCLSQCECNDLLITGMDLYSREPDHTGWMRHNPMGHCSWYTALAEWYPFIRLGDDLKDGIKYWRGQDEDDDS